MTTISAVANARVTIGGVSMTREAAGVVEWTGINPAVDVQRLRNEQVTPAGLAVECEDGADDAETISAWREYVFAVRLAAGV